MHVPDVHLFRVARLDHIVPAVEAGSRDQVAGARGLSLRSGFLCVCVSLGVSGQVSLPGERGGAAEVTDGAELTAEDDLGQWRNV